MEIRDAFCDLRRAAVQDVHRIPECYVVDIGVRPAASESPPGDMPTTNPPGAVSIPFSGRRRSR
ncbi:hypothetical protein GOOTI_114_00110 [Gordonia otitidis NBRC 100426]|uniref:Uncharacterized protein n=1 Tax=Gordonia otitidis (strain DSM 44809 / CCUG 52243 / JCM 12355 / NBRC 100426 / IFM 10032) TaxID=1108044 RepID=H5TM74_GORO1|nr:hypothetical protein GOOTI_114_00110 [Gordonia otitidis NBRC 100426]